LITVWTFPKAQRFESGTKGSGVVGASPHRFRPTYAGANVGHPCGAVGPAQARGETCGIPHLAKNERDAPNFLYAALERTACAPFFKERRRESREPTKLHRKSGVWGTRRLLRGWSPKVRSFHPTIGGGDRAEKLFDVGGGFLETTKGFRVVLDPELGAALLQVGFHRGATRQRLLLIRLVFRRPGRGSLRHIMP
jgi:hypothetical protein